MTNEMKPSRDIARLIEIMAALRTPKTGCPWDLEQNFKTRRTRSRKPMRWLMRLSAKILKT